MQRTCREFRVTRSRSGSSSGRANEVQRLPAHHPAAAPVETRELIPQELGPPLDETTRTDLEERFGADFRGVRVHTDTDAAASANIFGANAFTTGRDIYFAAGKYSPSTQEGKRLLAHELTHVLQQSAGK